MLFADDTEAMLGVAARLGVQVDIDRDREVERRQGMRRRDPGWARRSSTPGSRERPPGSCRRCSRSGTVGSASTATRQLRSRPLGPGIDALRRLGVRIVEEGAARAPSCRRRGRRPSGGAVTIDGEVSSQFLSGLMLAAPCAHSDLTIEVTGRQVSRPYVEMTAGESSLADVLDLAGGILPAAALRHIEVATPRRREAHHADVGSFANGTPDRVTKQLITFKIQYG